jgi:cytochrome c peroxidase
VPILFVSRDKNPEEWAGLKQFWTKVEVQPSALIGLSPLPAGALATTASHVKIKVPLGLADPTDQVPAGNRPTLGKWELGKRLFFDPDLLLPRGFVRLACADCHRPEKGFTRGFQFRAGTLRPIVRTPPLLNSAFNKYQFGDGRARYLEEVVYRPADERRQETSRDDLHVWGGVARRVVANPDYDARFKSVFGSPPTEDTVGKALATYLRTILTGNSLQDRAEQAMRDRNAKTLEPADYEKVLQKADLDNLNRLLENELIGAPKLDPAQTADAARQLHDGYRVFHGKGRCATCHSGPQYTDNGFHNLGIQLFVTPPERGQESGRFAALPIGLKDWRLIGAWKTPGLRSLPMLAPYFHDETCHSLFEAVRAHVHGGRFNPHRDPLLSDLDLSEDEVRALVLFLLALDGEPVDSVVVAPPK